jgi:hypothetical protein
VTILRYIGVLSVIACLAGMAGCRHYCCWGKRMSEKHCPTDVRKAHVWCFGEDAIFRWPCGPNSEFYGHKPTCWREWPAEAPVWRDLYCGPVGPEAGPYEQYDEKVLMGPTPIPAYPLPPAFGEAPDDPAAAPPQPPSEPLPPLDVSSSSRVLPEAEPAIYLGTTLTLRPYEVPLGATIEDETSVALQYYLSSDPPPKE